MAMFQGENSLFKIIIKDTSGDTIENTDIREMAISLYLESNYKEYAHWVLNSSPTYNDDGLYTPTDDSGSIALDGTLTTSGFLIQLESETTLLMTPGRYVIQITYNVAQGALTGGENTTQKGSLLTMKKAKR